MHPTVEINLSLILFVPWFAILGVLFWCFPKAPKSLARRAFDTTSLLLATAASAGGMYWGFYNADPTFGGLWKQILAMSVAYGLFLLVMTIAAVTRRRWLRPARATDPAASAHALDAETAQSSRPDRSHA